MCLLSHLFLVLGPRRLRGTGFFGDGNHISVSPVPELSFIPARRKRVQDNLHAHAENAATFSPQIEGKTMFESTFQIRLVARFSE